MQRSASPPKPTKVAKHDGKPHLDRVKCRRGQGPDSSGAVDDDGQAGAQRQQASTGHRHVTCVQPTIHPLTLRISGVELEAQFWRAARLLKVLDAVGLCSSVWINAMLMRRFGFGGEHPDWLSWHFLPIFTYFTAGIVQLCILGLAPRWHQRHRFRINLLNRLVKLASVSWAVRNMSDASVMSQFTDALNSTPAGSSAGGWIADAAASIRVVRTIASLPLIWVSHAVNFTLPFWIMLPLQLYTLAISAHVMPPTVCALAAQPPPILLVAARAGRRLCLAARVAACLVLGCSLPLTRSMPAGDSSTAGECGASLGAGVDAGVCAAAAAAGHDAMMRNLLLLVAFTYAVVLLLTPCCVAYFVELSWKRHFLGAQLAVQADPPPAHGEGARPLEAVHAWVVRLWLRTTLCAAAWLACDAAAAALPAVACQPA